jgi:BirA family biotin operon repressor/biotin-[acetyl-CoA-carboxylase] ligase
MFSALVWLDEVDSTQEVLKRGSFPPGTVVVANRQKGGKGRKGRRWESQEGGLYFSFVLEEKIFRELRGYPLVVGLGMKKAIEDLGLKPAIKWPNDIYLGGRKVCGILVEKRGELLYTGVGLNVNQEGFEGELSSLATSLRIVLGAELDLADVLLRVLKGITEELTVFSASGFAPLREEIRPSLLYLGEEVILSDEGKTIAGILKDIGDDGSLILQTAEGIKSFLAGDLTLRPLG